MTFVILGVYDAIKGPSLGLTQGQFVEVVNGLVDQRPEPPAPTAVAYANAIPSVVAIAGYDPEAYTKLPPAPPDERRGIKYEVIGTGVVLSVAGEAIAFVPNAIGRALLHNERL